MNLKFNNDSREKSEQILRKVITYMSNRQKEKFLNDYATKILQVDKYHQNWEKIKSYFNTNIPKLENFFPILRNYDAPELIPNVYDLYFKENKFEESELAGKYLFNLVTSLRSGLPNQPLLS